MKIVSCYCVKLLLTEFIILGLTVWVCVLGKNKDYWTLQWDLKLIWKKSRFTGVNRLFDFYLCLFGLLLLQSVPQIIQVHLKSSVMRSTEKKAGIFCICAQLSYENWNLNIQHCFRKLNFNTNLFSLI